MEFNLKIKTKFDAIINIESKLKRKIEENDFQTFKLNLDENENFIVNIEPIKRSETILLPYNIYVKNSNGKLLIDSPNIEVLSFRNNYIINLLKLEVVKDMKVLYSQNNFSVFNTFTTNITTSLGSVALPELFSNVETEKVNSLFLLKFFGKRKYLIIISNNDIIFNDYYDEINIKKNIEILSNLYDYTGHSVITKIENKNINKRIVYTNIEPKIARLDKIIPTVFLQALKVENIKLCKYYLSDNLNGIANINSLKTFFGDFKKVEQSFENNNSIILFYKNNNGYFHKIFNFEIINNKITKIETL